MVSFGIAVYLVARAAPRIGDEVSDGSTFRISKFDKFFSHDKFEKFDVVFNTFIEKALRKVKLLLMKLDNLTNEYLDKVKKYKTNGNGKNGIEKPSLFERGSDAKSEIEEKTDESM